MNGLPSIRGVRAVLGHGRLLVLLVATVVFTTLAGTAFGYWSTTGTGTGSASTGTLNAPTSVRVTSAPGSGSAGVSWTAPTGTPGAHGYYVKRTPAGGGTSAFACGTDSSSLNTSTSCTDSGVADGTYTYTVTAIYNSWTATSASSSSVTVSNSVGTTTTLKSSLNPSVVGQQVTYTATVTPASGPAPSSGSVTFSDESGSIACAAGSVAFSAGSATCSVTYAAAGTHSITATYVGSSSFGGSTSSPALSQIVNTASLISTTTQMVSSQNPAKSGTQVTYTATVSPNSGSATPTGTMTFTEGSNAVACETGSQTLTAGVATCKVTYPVIASSLGSHPITATYSGNATYATSTGGLAQRIVNGNVTGVNFANVTVNGSPVPSPTCSGVGTATVTCSISGTGNSAAVSADVAFVNQSGAATLYATDLKTSVGWNGTSKSTPLSGTLDVLASATTSTSRSASASKNGSNPATLTYTFTDAGTSYSATLTLN